MVLYFANRKMDILGMATTELMEGFTVSGDLKTEDTDTGVATFECTIHWTEETRAIAEAATTAGNYLLRSYNNENEFYTITETEVDTKAQSIYIYAEDAGMDLLNETVGAFEATEAHPAEWYIEMYSEDTGFEIGINEIADLSRKLEWTGTATAAERIASVATQFDNAEISYSYEIKGLTITHKYINIHKKRGKDVGVQLRLNRDVDRIITTTSVADLATALYVTGGTPEGSEDPITLAGYSYDDGDFYVEDGLLKSREALKVWSRYVWDKEPGQIEGYTGHIVKQWSYDTTSQSELCNRAITQLGKICKPAVNYEIDIQQLPENVGVGDYVYVVDEKGELYLQSRILKLTTSVCNQKQTATLGEFLIQESGISQTVKELAEQFAQLAKSRQYYVWIVYADDEYGDGISLDPDGKTYMGTCTTSEGPDPDLSDPSRYKWSLIQGENGVGIAEINTYYGKSDSPTDVPTVWQEEPYELLHNEYQWSYTEIIYTNGVVELTSPTIIAYYDYLNVDELEARVAKIEEAYVSYEEVELLVADDVEAAIINAGFLTADSAVITNLTAFEENVTALLAGSAGVGELQTIYITSANAVIESAVIVDALMGTVLADIITSNVIYTDYIKIADNEDRSLWIDGSTMQFTDENGTVRVQIGLDASGNYNYYLWDADGNLIWDPMGLTEAGLTGNGAIIKDAAVADDANISGYKLNIEEVVSIINENGEYEIDASSVTIDGETLDYKLAQITQSITDIDGLKNITPYFALGLSDTEPPLDPDDILPAYVGTAKVGYSYVGIYDWSTIWTTTQPIAEDGEYLWMRFFLEYEDGTTEWSEAVCLTDGWVRSHTSVLQTELSVVQGDIAAKIWMSDITEITDMLGNEITEVADQYTILELELGNIWAYVGDISTTMEEYYTSLDSRITEVTVTAERLETSVTYIESTVANLEGIIESLDGVKDLTAYYALGYSYTEPPADADTLLPAYVGTAKVGYSYVGIYDWSSMWTTDQPTAGEGQYLWMRWLIEYEDGSTAWSDAICLTDVYNREYTSTLATSIRELADSITMSVSQVESDLTGLQVSLEAQIQMLTDSISLSVTDGVLGKTAQIILTVNGEDIEQEIDLARIRQAFADDDSTIIIEAGVVAFAANTFRVDSDYFTVTEDGHIYATAGLIGSWTIGDESLYNGTDSMDSVINGTYIGIDGIRQYYDGEYLNITSTTIINGGADGYETRLSQGRFALYYDSVQSGHISAVYKLDNPEHRGIGIILPQDSTGFIGFGRSDSSSTFTPAYEINYGSNSNYSERHIFYNTTRFNGYVTIGSHLYMANHRIYLDSDEEYYISSAASGGLYSNGTVSAVKGLFAGGQYNLSYLLGVYGDAYIDGSLRLGSFWYGVGNFNGSPISYTIGNIVTFYFYNHSATAILACLENFKPVKNCSFPVIYSNSGMYLGYVYYNGAWNVRAILSYGSNGTETGSESGYYGKVSFIEAA